MQTDGHFSTAVLGETAHFFDKWSDSGLACTRHAGGGIGDRLSSCRKMFGVNSLHFIMRTLSHETYIKAESIYHLVFDT